MSHQRQKVSQLGFRLRGAGAGASREAFAYIAQGGVLSVCGKVAKYVPNLMEECPNQ